MTREQKIEALVKELGYENSENIEDIKEIILAGIALRDAELLAVEFDSLKAHLACGTRFTTSFQEGARWQFEQFIKSIKGDGDDSNAP